MLSTKCLTRTRFYFQNAIKSSKIYDTLQMKSTLSSTNNFFYMNHLSSALFNGHYHLTRPFCTKNNKGDNGNIDKPNDNKPVENKPSSPSPLTPSDDDTSNIKGQTQDHTMQKEPNKLSDMINNRIKKNQSNSKGSTPSPPPIFDNTTNNSKTIPLAPIKLNLEPWEKKLPQKSYILFSSTNPIIPYTQQQCEIKTGNLDSTHINTELAYFLKSKDNEIYPIGVILKNEVNKTIKDDMKAKYKSNKNIIFDDNMDYIPPQHQKQSSGSTSSTTAYSLNTAASSILQPIIKASIITKPKNYRIKIVEIEYKSNCYFIKGIPYNDRPLRKDEEIFNIIDELKQIKALLNPIKSLTQNDKIDVFQHINLDKFIKSDSINEILTKLDNENKEQDDTKTKKTKGNLLLNPKYKEELDEQLYLIVNDIMKFFNNVKDANINIFIQNFLEQRTIQGRIILLKTRLTEIIKILEIAHRSTKTADESIWKSHEMAKAKISIDHINSIYSLEPIIPGMAGSGFGNQMSGQLGASQIGGGHMSSVAKKFLEKLHLIENEVSRDKIKKEIERFGTLDRQSAEYQKIYTYLDEVFSIPWKTYTDEVWDIKYSKEVLTNEIYGLEKVKDRIMELISINKLQITQEEQSPSSKKGFIILLYGPPGIGKTSIAKSIAKALKRESRFISFAGVSDIHFIKGHNRTYVDSQPGVFIKELIKAKTSNPVFVLDEIDKLSKTQTGGDIYNSLLEILNTEENHNFTDHYLDIAVDFSQVIFVLTANSILNMLDPLRNRLETIEIPPYHEQEKLNICKKYLLPQVLIDNGLEPDSIKFDDATLRKIIKGWCYYESGVRKLKRCIETIARKQAWNIVNNHYNTVSYSKSGSSETPEFTHEPTSVGALNKGYIKPISLDMSTNKSPQGESVEIHNMINPVNEAATTITTSTATTSTLEKENKPTIMDQQVKFVNSDDNSQNNPLKLVFDHQKDPQGKLLKEYLGMPEWDAIEERKFRKELPGRVNVLTVSNFTGSVLTVECVYDYSHIEKKSLFTSTGNIKKILEESLNIGKINANRFLLPEQRKEFSEKNVHMHFMQGSIPKDGPSAGVSICTAYLSLMLNRPVPADIAMTGELSLNGDVCNIGGLQAKITAAKALDIKRLIIPYGNKNEFYELPNELKEDVTVYFVKNYDEVYNLIFGKYSNNVNTHDIEYWKDGKYHEATQSNAQNS